MKKANNKRVIKSENIVPPKAIGLTYSKELMSLVRKMAADYKSLIYIYSSKKNQIAMDAAVSKEKLDEIERWIKEKGYKTKGASIKKSGSAYINVFLPSKQNNGEVVYKWAKIRISDHFKNTRRDVDFAMQVSPLVSKEVFTTKFDTMTEYVKNNNVSSIIELRDRVPTLAKIASATWLTTDIQDRLDTLGEKWGERFMEFAKHKSKETVKKVLRSTDIQIKKTLIRFYSQERLELIGNVIPEPLKQIMNAHIMENVSLIKSVHSQYHERITGAIVRSITGQGSIKTLAEEISKYNKEGLNRAHLIALDQTRKMYSTLTLERFKQVGVEKVQWLHTHGGKTVREYHYRKWDGISGQKNGHPNGLNGFIFDINNPPVIQEAKGKQLEIRGFPGTLPFCTCVMAAVVE